MPLEDFTTYVVSDPGGDLAITATLIDTITAVTPTENITVHSDKGIDFFTGDWEFEIEHEYQTAAVDSGGSYCAALATLIGTYQAIWDSSGNAIGVRPRLSGSSVLISTNETSGGSSFFGTSSLPQPVGTTVFLTLSYSA